MRSLTGNGARDTDAVAGYRFSPTLSCARGALNAVMRSTNCSSYGSRFSWWSRPSRIRR